MYGKNKDDKYYYLYLKYVCITFWHQNQNSVDIFCMATIEESFKYCYYLLGYIYDI